MPPSAAAALLVSAAAALAAGAAPKYATTKRVFGTTNSSADYAFFLRYLGAADPGTNEPADGAGVCLERNLAWVLPDKFGIHFPQSHRTSSEVAGTSLADWDARRVRMIGGLAGYHAMLDYATALYVPDLGPHHARFAADGVAVLRRRSTFAGGAPLYSLFVATPGSGQAFELSAPACSGCGAAEWAEYGAGECAASHQLPRDPAFYAAEYAFAASASPGYCFLKYAANGTVKKDGTSVCAPAAGGGCARCAEGADVQNAAGGSTYWAQVTEAGCCDACAADPQCVVSVFLPAQPATLPGGLPAPMVTQLRVATTNVTEAARFVRTFYEEDPTPAAASGGCAVARWATGTAPFDGEQQVRNATVDFVFVQNDAAAGRAAWAEWEGWVAALHAAFTGDGWGFDRALDYHVKIMAAGSTSATRDGVSLDAWARRHDGYGARYAAFNTSHACPSGGFAFGDGGMLYSAGVCGVQGVEFWGPFDGSVFTPDQLFGWGSCSPSMDCSSQPPRPMCARAGGGGAAAVAPADHPSAAAPRSRVDLRCAAGATIAAVTFAAFGTPTGDCDAGFAQGECAAPADRVLALARAACVNRTACSLLASSAALGGDPCPGTEKALAVAVRCA